MRGFLVLVFGAQLAASMPDPDEAVIAWTVAGEFCEPETVLPLPDDTLLVSNVCDFRKAGNGFLTLLGGTGEVIDWRVVEGLDAPLGMALVDGLLYVVDNNQVRILEWPGYQAREIISLETQVANDIAVATDHTLYVTDTARGEVTVITPGREQSLLVGAGAFSGANGLYIDDRVLYVGGERLWRVDLEDSTVSTIGPAWLADIDGIEMEADGTLQVTPVGGPLVRLGTEIQVLGGDGVSSANHGYAERLKLALIPTGFDNTVLAIQLAD